MTAGLIVAAALVVATVIIAAELIRRREEAISQHAGDADATLLPRPVSRLDRELAAWHLENAVRAATAWKPCGCRLVLPVDGDPYWQACAEHAEQWAAEEGR